MTPGRLPAGSPPGTPSAAPPCRWISPPTRKRRRSRSSSGLHLHRPAGCLPARVAAVHVLGVEAGVAQLDGGLAADVEAVGAIDHHRFRLRQLADPLVELLRI